jgi:hypothetical protein
MKWIPVTESLPYKKYELNHGVKVLITYSDNRVCEAYFNHYTKKFEEPQSTYPDFDTFKNVIAWMPMPEPYVNPTSSKVQPPPPPPFSKMVANSTIMIREGELP